MDEPILNLVITQRIEHVDEAALLLLVVTETNGRIETDLVDQSQVLLLDQLALSQASFRVAIKLCPN